MSFFSIVNGDVWYIISKYLTFEQILLISLFDKTPYPKDSYVFREFYEQEIGGNITESYKQEILKVLEEIKDLSAQELLDYSRKKGYIGGNITENYKREILRVLEEIKDLSAQELLVYSCKKGYIGLVKTSILKGADIKANDYYPLITAIINGHLEISRYFAELDIEIEGINIKVVVRRLAILHRKLEIVRYFVELDTECIKDYNNFDLRLAANYGYHEIVKYLLSKGADISVLTEERQKYYSS